MAAQLLGAVVMVSLHRCILDRAVHARELAVGPRVVWHDPGFRV